MKILDIIEYKPKSAELLICKCGSVILAGSSAFFVLVNEGDGPKVFKVLCEKCFRGSKFDIQ